MSELEWPLRMAIALALTVASIFVSQRYVDGGTDRADPQEIVLDEFVGVLIAFAVIPWTAPWVVLAFLLFRAFDILKPGPVGMVDRKMKNAAGIVLDDAVAGLMAAAVLVVLQLTPLGDALGRIFG